MVKPSSSSSYSTSSRNSNGKKKGSWTKEEDNKLRNYVQRHGHWNWRLLPKFAGLERCGKSCRLRWINYLKPGLKKGKFSKEEKELIIKLHKELGNKWSAIAEKFPGRTDNDIKNFWHAHIQKHNRRISNESAKLSTEENCTNQSSANEVLCVKKPEEKVLSIYENGTTYDIHANNIYCLSPLPDGELSSFGTCSSFWTSLDWIADYHDHSSMIISNSDPVAASVLIQEDFWNEPFVTHAPQEEGGLI